MKRSLFILILMIILSACRSYPQDLSSINLPENFYIEIYAEDIPTARGMDFADDGTLFVGSKTGEVYAVSRAGVVRLIAEGLDMPVGLDYYDGDLYVSSISKIVKFPSILTLISQDKEGVFTPDILFDRLPSDVHHGWKFIKFGPDGKLYIPIGAPCNVCSPDDPRYASISRIDKQGGTFEIVAHGVRNSVGFDWHPDTGELWFTDNGRDMMGDDIPPDELNRLETEGSHFGYPHIHGEDIKDPEFYTKRDRSITYISPEVALAPHTAALGMRFYTGNMFPPYYRKGIFIAEHGSWNRSKKMGYRITFVKPGSSDYEIFAQGWEIDEVVSGRPADVEVGPDGALYISDDAANVVYRIYYKE